MVLADAVMALAIAHRLVVALMVNVVPGGHWSAGRQFPCDVMGEA